MKTIAILTSVTLLAMAGQPAGAGTPMPSMAMKAAVKTGSGIGTVTAVDQRSGTVTIAHGPIPGVGWPAMTMTFKAAPPVLTGLSAGKKIGFDVAVTDASAIVTKVRAR